MLLATFQYHKTFGTEKNNFNGFYHNNYKGVAAILDMYHINFRSFFMRRLDIEFCLNWPSGFRGKYLSKWWMTDDDAIVLTLGVYLDI